MAFVLFLSISGITLNHASDMGLDRRYVGWSWLLDAYGIEMPPPSASFVDAGHRATLLGERVFLDGRDIERSIPTMTGMAWLDPLVIVAGEQTTHVLTIDGELVESIDLGTQLPGPIQRVGRHDGRVVLQSNDTLFLSDPDIVGFEAWEGSSAEALDWSVAQALDETTLASLEVAYRGRGLTVERVLLDLHSGRFFAMPGTLFMDIIAVSLIVLSLSGLFMASSRNRRENGARANGGN